MLPIQMNIKKYLHSNYWYEEIMKLVLKLLAD